MSQIASYTLSDVHGFIFSTDFPSREKDSPMGLLRANHLIKRDCVHYDGNVKIDNGDFLQGSPSCNYLVSKLKSSLPLTSIYNRLGFGFGTVGNHEFNYGLPYLEQAISQLHYPVLCANTIENTQSFTSQGIHYFKVNNLAIGTIRLTTQYIPHWE